MKEFLEKLIKETEELIKTSNDVEQVRSLGAKLTEYRSQLAKLPVEKPALDPLKTMGSFDNRDNKTDLEKRMAFAKLMTSRANQIDHTTDVTAVIPENLIPQIVETIDNYGMILPLITKTNFAVGQSIPVDGAKPTATWVSEGAGSDSQKKTINTKIVFGAFKLRCEIRFTQEVNVQTLAVFESTFVKQVGEAMAKAIETKIMSANAGSDSPTGILYRSSGSDANVDILKLATGHLDYKALCDAEALLPQQYEANAKWFMSKKTFMSIYALTDSNGQPIGRINYGLGGKPERYILGREVVCNPYVDDYVETTATADKVVAFLFNMEDYCLNTSYDLGIQKAVDWDTEDTKIKAVMSVDGKVLVRESLVKITKKYN